MKASQEKTDNEGREINMEAFTIKTSRPRKCKRVIKNRKNIQHTY
jgi:hypothetical protein